MLGLHLVGIKTFQSNLTPAIDKHQGGSHSMVWKINSCSLFVAFFSSIIKKKGQNEEDMNESSKDRFEKVQPTHEFGSEQNGKIAFM